MTVSYLDILAETIRNNWDQPALTDFYLTEDGKAQDTSRGNHYTYGGMYEEIVRVADLLTNLGLQKGDHIAICGINSAHWVIAYLAIAKMQGVSVTVMHSLQPDEIARLVDFSDAKALFVDEDLWNELKHQSLPQIQSVISLDQWAVLFGERQVINHDYIILNGECGFGAVEPDSLAMICFTSGSTGKPKGVMLPYRSVSANVAIKFERFITSKGRISMSWLPMGHVYGLLAEVLQPMCIGIRVVVVRAFEQSNFIQMVQCVRPAILMTVPIVLENIITNIKHHTTDVQIIRNQLLQTLGDNLDLVGVGGSLLSSELEAVLYSPDIPLGMSYGCTECGPRIALALADELRLQSVGIVLPTLQASIAPNGEILVKGENVMLGYYKDPEATAAKIDKDGWLHTGDKGYLDEDGYLYVEGRLEQDIIVLPNGENIRPDNIEALINALPEVKESIVLARDGKLVAIVVPEEAINNQQAAISLRRNVLRTVNPQLPLFSQLYDVEITDQPLQRTEKQTIKRYMYK